MDKHFIARDKKESDKTEQERYFVHDDKNVILYRGSYTQCLVIIGGLAAGYTIAEIWSKCNDVLQNHWCGFCQKYYTGKSCPNEHYISSSTNGY